MGIISSIETEYMSAECSIGISLPNLHLLYFASDHGDAARLFAFVRKRLVLPFRKSMKNERHCHYSSSLSPLALVLGVILRQPGSEENERNRRGMSANGRLALTIQYEIKCYTGIDCFNNGTMIDWRISF